MGKNHGDCGVRSQCSEWGKALWLEWPVKGDTDTGSTGLERPRLQESSVTGMACGHTLQALVYDILPSTTAVFSYAIGSRKLLANEQFFVGAQTVVSVLQTTQIKQGVSFIAKQSLHQHK